MSQKDGRTNQKDIPFGQVYLGDVDREELGARVFRLQTSQQAGLIAEGKSGERAKGKHQGPVQRKVGGELDGCFWG